MAQGFSNEREGMMRPQQPAVGQEWHEVNSHAYRRDGNVEFLLMTWRVSAVYDRGYYSEIVSREYLPGDDPLIQAELRALPDAIWEGKDER